MRPCSRTKKAYQTTQERGAMETWVLGSHGGSQGQNPKVRSPPQFRRETDLCDQNPRLHRAKLLLLTDIATTRRTNTLCHAPAALAPLHAHHARRGGRVSNAGALSSCGQELVRPCRMAVKGITSVDTGDPSDCLPRRGTAVPPPVCAPLETAGISRYALRWSGKSFLPVDHPVGVGDPLVHERTIQVGKVPELGSKPSFKMLDLESILKADSHPCTGRRGAVDHLDDPPRLEIVVSQVSLVKPCSGPSFRTVATCPILQDMTSST